MTTEELDIFETNLEQHLMKVCRSFGLMGDVLLSSDDIDGKWKEWAPEYIAEAVKTVSDYPQFSVACAGYAGMAVAKWWDEDWGRHHGAAFSSLLGSRGFDNMDDHIIESVLGLPLESVEGGALFKNMELISQACWDFIRKSSVESGTADAFHAFARACRVMFRVSASVELRRLGYRYQAVQTSRFSN